MKTLQLISSGGLYGAEAVVKNLAVYLSRLGCDSRVGIFLNSRNPHLELADCVAGGSVVVKVFPCRGRFDASTVRAIRAYVRSEHIDVCNTHGYKADLFGLAAVEGLSAALVTTRHAGANEHELGRKLRFYAIAENLTARYFAKVLAVSDPIAKKLRRWGVPSTKVSVVSNGVDLDAFQDAIPKWGPRNGKVIGYVGRLTEEKGAFDLVEAMPRVLAGIPDARAVLVGEGVGREALEERISRLGIGQSIKLQGAVAHSEMPSVYASFDILALPSHGEGMPMCVLEGMASGCAVIATRVGGIPALIEHGKSGILVEPRATDALATELIRLLGEPERTAALSGNGKAAVRERYSAEAMARRYLAEYEELASRC
jgi:glycosyltransferase involved in cell wall biosynthesis